MKKITAVLCMLILCASTLLSACSGGDTYTYDPVPRTEPTAELTCTDTDEGHVFGEWDIYDAVNTYDGMCRLCSVCGKAEHKSGWTSVKELPPSSITDDIKKLAGQMPEAKYNSLPDWNGVRIWNFAGDDTLSASSGYVVTEEQIKLISDLGFNYIKVNFDYGKSPFLLPDLRHMFSSFYMSS